MISQYKSRNLPIKYKIILIGDCNVGKTSLFYRYIKNEPLTKQQATIIDFRYKKIKITDKEVQLCIWDTAGQQRFKSLVATYYKSCRGVILMFDMTNVESFRSIQTNWYQQAQQKAPDACFLLIGNKADAANKMPLDEIYQWCKQKGIYFIEASAATGYHVNQSFFTLAAFIETKIETKITETSDCDEKQEKYSSGISSETTVTPSTHRQSVLAVYQMAKVTQKSNSFLLKTDFLRDKRQKKNCC